MPDDIPDKINPEDLRIEKIDRRHITQINNFESSYKELKDFLVEDALGNQEMAISTTYLWFYNPKNELLMLQFWLMQSEFMVQD